MSLSRVEMPMALFKTCPFVAIKFYFCQIASLVFVLVFAFGFFNQSFFMTYYGAV